MASSSEIDNRVFDSTTNSIRTTSGGSSGAPTVSFVGDGAASTTLIAANASRRSVKFYNQSPANLYLREGAAAASIAAGGYTVMIQSGGFYETEVPSEIRGIWDSDAGGYVNITEVV